MNEHHPLAPAVDSADDTDTTVRLLRAAGPRAPLPQERFARVRGAVLAHWNAGVRRQVVRRRGRVGVAFLAAAALVLFAVRIYEIRTNDSMNAGSGVPAASETAIAWVAKITGSGTAHYSSSSSSSAPTRRLALDEPVLAGETVDTGADGRLALRMGGDASLRLDVNSRVRLFGPRAVELLNGGVYLDTDRARGQFEIRTPLGTVRDIGTQFEVRLLGERVRLRVRTGVVEVIGTGKSTVGRAGTEILLSSSSEESTSLAPYGREWAWVGDVSPAIDIEGIPLSTFLERLAREQGWSVHYADSTLADEAGRIILHGSVAGLTPAESLEVTVGTSGLLYKVDDGQLVVSRERSR